MPENVKSVESAEGKELGAMFGELNSAIENYRNGLEVVWRNLERPMPARTAGDFFESNLNSLRLVRQGVRDLIVAVKGKISELGGQVEQGLKEQISTAISSFEAVEGKIEEFEKAHPLG